MTNLRGLVVDDGDCRMVPTEVQFPPSLQHLKFTGLLGPSVLAAATQMTHLILDSAVVEGEGDVSGGACLLEVLPKLQHLEALCLYEAAVDWPPPSPAYRALVASSSKLRVLHIDSCELPDGALAHIFPSAPPHHIMLTSLVDVSFHDDPWDADVVASLVGCCPALLRLFIVSKGGAHLAALSQLSALTLLDLYLGPDDDGGDGASTAVSIQSLVGLTRLQALRVLLNTGPYSMRCKDLLPLTALRQLTDLKSSCDQLPHSRLKTQAGPGQPPDVWLQLLERCAADSECQPAISRNLAQQLLQQEALTGRQQQELTDLQQQLAEQQQYIARLQQHVTDLRQQQLKDRQQVQAQQQHNAEVQEQLTSQGGLLRELQAQVQELLSQWL